MSYMPILEIINEWGQRIPISLIKHGQREEEKLDKMINIMQDLTAQTQDITVD